MDRMDDGSRRRWRGLAFAGLFVRALCALGAIAVWMGALPGGAWAASSVSLTASPASITPGEFSTLTATASLPSGSLVFVYDVTDGGRANVTSCSASPCTATVSMLWSENRAPKDRVYLAQVVENWGSPSSERVTSEASVTVEHRAIDMSTTLTASPSSIDPTQTSVLTARVADLTWLPSGYWLEIFDATDGTSQRLTTCTTLPCTTTVGMLWSENRAPKDRVYRAVLTGGVGGPNPYTESQSLPITVEHRAVDLSTVLVASPASIDPTQTSTLTATVASALPAGYQLYVYDVTDGGRQRLMTCTTATCTTTVVMLWSENRVPKDRIYQTELWGNVSSTYSTYLESTSQPVTVAHRAVDMTTTLTASLGSIERSPELDVDRQGRQRAAVGLPAVHL